MYNMANTIFNDASRADLSQSFISSLHFNLSDGLPHAEPVSALRTNERELVQGVLKMLQGFSSFLFYWDENGQSFHVKNGIYTSHLSQTSLNRLLDQFNYSGTCLKQVEFFVKKVKASCRRTPTLEAFANSVYLWFKRLRAIALKEEMRVGGSDTGVTSTLLGLTNSLSRLCSGAAYLLQIVTEAIPRPYFESEISVPAAEMAVHILDNLFRKLNEVCLVQGGKEEAYHMLLAIFAGSLLPYLEGLDSWLYDGILDDPYEEMFFYANDTVAIDQPAFWERSYLLRTWRWKDSRSGISLVPADGESEVRKEISNHEDISFSSSARGRDLKDTDIVVPVFLKIMARAIVSAGKSLQLIQHVQDEYIAVNSTDRDYDSERSNMSTLGCISTVGYLQVQVEQENLSSQQFEKKIPSGGHSDEKSTLNHCQIGQNQLMGLLTLSEVFLVSLSGLIGEGHHLYKHFSMSSPQVAQICKYFSDEQELVKGIKEDVATSMSFKKIWFKFLADASLERSHVDITKEIFSQSTDRILDCAHEIEETKGAEKLHTSKCLHVKSGNVLGDTLVSFCHGNPVISVCREFLKRNMASWDELNISRKFHLPPLNDEKLREAIFCKKCTNANKGSDDLDEKPLPQFNGTDYTFGFQFGELERLRLEEDIKTLETMCPFPTLLPCFQEDLPMSELLPFQKNSTLASRVLKWIQEIQLKDTSLPAVIVQECLAVYIKHQVDHVGKHILLKLMNDWKLMDELGVLRAIYLLGSGDLLQQFLIVIFDKLDKGDPWDDDFELNTILQMMHLVMQKKLKIRDFVESIRNSADGALLSAPDSLIVSMTKNNTSDDEQNAISSVLTPRKVLNHCFGIDALDLLKFTYKVSWPLDLIANTEAIKKYNQVMGFLLKVKRAKFVLDKTRRWMWKGRGSRTYGYKHHLLVEQKLLHFVDAFHQYVMDRVFHSAWVELCSGMASAGSLDEVLEVHEAYLLSVQRQCFVAPDKVWALIASRVKSILGLALDFYFIQQTLNSGGAAPAIKARCEMEVDRIEKQFDDCIAFLLRILSFKLNVGQFPHLADLVTRINYNYYYMSESGNLQTIPSFEASAAKVGKTSLFRTE